MMKVMSFSGNPAAQLGRAKAKTGAAKPAARNKSRRVNLDMSLPIVYGGKNSAAGRLNPLLGRASIAVAG
jgi:hypothetical protein